MAFWRLPKRLNIRQVLFLSHLVLVAWLISALSISRYQSEWHTQIRHQVEMAQTALNPVISLISPAAAGLNYTIPKLPSSLALYRGIPKLKQFEVIASSDYSRRPFGFAFQMADEALWYTTYHANDIIQAEQQISELQQRLNTPGADSSKLRFLLNRSLDRKLQIEQDLRLAAQSTSLFQNTASQSGDYLLNEHEQTLDIRQPLRNQNSGTLQARFDASELLRLRNDLLMGIIQEALIALGISLLVIIWATRWIVRPLNTLSLHMGKDVAELHPHLLPERDRNDEIGFLARRFGDLIGRIRSHIDDLEKLSYEDALTGLGSRYAYQQRGQDLLNQCRRSGGFFALFVCDIDHFKKYNDNLGHLQGDSALKQVARQLADAMHRQTDQVFRVGGEEFVILAQLNAADEAIMIGERVRKSVLAANIPHPANPPIQCVSLSMGAVILRPDHLQLNENIHLASLFEVADQALYRAKENGRNRLEFASIDSALNQIT